MSLNVKYSLFLSDFHETTFLSTEFQKIEKRQTAITNVVIGYPEIIGLLKFFDLFLGTATYCNATGILFQFHSTWTTIDGIHSR
jgi:hypothetical protein